jgi:hypothetical protein
MLLPNKMVGQHLFAVALQIADLAEGHHLLLAHLPSVFLAPTMLLKHKLIAALHIADLAEV